jgi:diguanylate cyclase (GGDEF)-like protein
MGAMREWFGRFDGTRAAALRRVAGVVCLIDALVVLLAPYATSRTADQRGLYGWSAAALALVGTVLILVRGVSDRWGAQLAIGVPNALILVLLAMTNRVGTLPVLLMWSALASPYFAVRYIVRTNLVVITVGMAAVVMVSPDPLVSWFTWLVVVAACAGCAVTVRVIAEQNSAIVDTLSEKANRDGLTGLLNRRGFDESLEGLWGGPGRLAVVFFDLDHFKIVNDTYGHPVGDVVLVEFGRVLSGHVRDGDVVARTGGEEFGVVMPGRGVANVLERAWAVVDAFAATRIQTDDLVLRCTVSAGVAVRESRHTSASHLCRDADRALYMAKEGGRNQAVLREGDRVVGGS